MMEPIAQYANFKSSFNFLKKSFYIVAEDNISKLHFKWQLQIIYIVKLMYTLKLYITQQWKLDQLLL